LKRRQAVYLALVCVVAALAASYGARAGASAGVARRAAAPAPRAGAAPQSFVLTDFGAAGDGVTDDGPALQAALDALAAAGGGTLHVPAGRYAIVTPVAKTFPDPTISVNISGVPSDVPAPPHTAGGEDLTRGLGLTSEFLPRTGAATAAVYVEGLRSLVVEELAFVGTPDVWDDAAYTLYLSDVGQATVRHSEFYGIASMQGAVIIARRSALSVERSVFLGCATSSGVYASVIQNTEWKSASVTDTVFTDYGQRPDLYGKLGMAAPWSWVNLGDPAPPTAESPRREAVFRNVFFDEGGLNGVSTMPRVPTESRPIDLLHVSGLRMNVSNLRTSGLYLEGLRGALVEDAFFGWSSLTETAVNLLGAGSAVLSRLDCDVAVTTVRADSATDRLAAVDVRCPEVASLAPSTRVFNAATPDDDPTLYVRSRFQAALGRAPDPAAHFYWADRILRCGASAACVMSERAALAAYLASGPQPTFALEGRATDEAGRALAGVAVTLAGSQAAAAVTDADGRYRFQNLPTSGVYTVSAAKAHYTFARPSLTVTTPAGGRVVDFAAALDRHTLSGLVVDAFGRGVQGVTVTLSGGRSAAATTDAGGAFVFASLPAGADYALTPSSARYSFAPASQSFDDLGADAAAVFSGTPLFHSITAQVFTVNNAPVPGARVTLAGAKSAQGVTDSKGFVVFGDLPRGGSYTLAPAPLVGYAFPSGPQTFNNLTADQGYSFFAAPTAYKLRGRVTAGGAALPGVAVTLSGSASAATTTDAAGDYAFDIPASGDYTVTASKRHYTFAPASAAFSAVTGERRADFAATLNRHRIAGRVARADGRAMAGVTVTLSGAQAATTTTDAAGDYAFANLPAGGSYTVTPSRAGYDFAPASRSFADLGADQTAPFVVSPGNYVLAGRVTAGGAPLAGVTVTLSGARSATATTDANGAYSFGVSSEGGYTVTASKTNYTFAPPSVSFSDPVGNKTADFAATLNRYRIAGRVTNPNNYGLAGVTVTLSGAQAATATTDAAGDYAFPNLPAGGSYTVTPSLPTLAFAPASRAFNDLGADARADFVGSLATYRLSGRVTQNGAGLSGVSVGLAGAHPALGRVDGHFVTAADGAYAFDVPAAGDYTVAPSKKDYAFAPASATFKGLAASASADFAASPLPTFEFSASSYEVHEDGGSVLVTVTRRGDTGAEATVVYQAVGDTARRGADFLASIGQLTFAPGETSKTFEVFITDDAFVEGVERFSLTLAPGEGAGAVASPPSLVTIDDNDDSPAGANPVDSDEFFVRQHYRDFFSREPDAEGLAFWTGELAKCGADAKCREARRVSVSAAFFLSIEFQETGYLVYRLYRAAYERAPERVEEFMLDARVMGEGVVVGRGGWEQRLKENRAAFVRAFVERPQFAARYPASLTPEQFVDALFRNADVAPSATERQAAVDDFGGAPTSADAESRALALRRVAEGEALKQQESNRAFVLMQYFGYLRRGPAEAPDDDLDGYNFWLSKLEEFGGDYERAEMVKAFLSSAEYRGRFGN
jgi:inhibitor of cysteine peptidase